MDENTKEGGPFEIEVAFKDGSTNEDRIALAPKIQDLIKALDEAEGTEDALPLAVESLTIRRVS